MEFTVSSFDKALAATSELMKIKLKAVNLVRMFLLIDWQLCLVYHQRKLLFSFRYGIVHNLDRIACSNSVRRKSTTLLNRNRSFTLYSNKYSVLGTTYNRSIVLNF